MPDELDSGDLSPDAKTYFESGGESLPAPVTPPEPEGAEPDSPEPGEPDSASREAKQVPLAALTEARREAKAFKAEMDTIRRENAVLADRWNTLLKVQEQQQPADADPEPDPTADLFGHQAWLARQVKTTREESAARANQEAQQRQEAQQEQAVWNYWQQDATEYAKTVPEFGEAASWLSDFRDKQLQALAVVDPRFADPRARNAQIETELKQIVVGAARQEKSAAQLVHEIAKGYGYTKKAPAADPAAEVAKVAAAVSQSTSLSGTSGGRPTGQMDAAAVAALSSSEFEAWLSKNGDKGFRRLMGG